MLTYCIDKYINFKQMESTLYISFLICYYKYVKYTFHLLRRLLVKNCLEEIRKQKGIKQEDLALALEVSRQTIGSLENGRYNPSIILAFKIAKFFNLSIEEIFIYEE